jgi:hypothetical protein
MIPMSNISWYESSINMAKVKTYSSNIEAHPCFRMLRRSMEIVAKEKGGRLANSITDSRGQTTACDLAITFPAFPRGIGVKIDRNTGQVAFLCDNYGGYEQLASRITGEVTRNYVSIALISAMRSLGYKVEEVRSKQTETVRLVGNV